MLKRLTLLCLVILAASCGSSPTAPPTPTPSPTPTGNFTITGMIRTAAPTSRPKGSVWIQYYDSSEPRGWKKVWVPYEQSTFRLENVQAGQVWITSSAPLFLPARASFTLTGDRDVELIFTPEPKTIERWLSPTSFDDCPTSWGVEGLCQAMKLETHHSGPVTATATWDAAETNYRMELWRGEGERVASSTAAGRGRATLTGAAVGGEYHYLRLLFTEPLRTRTVFDGIVTLPN